MYKFLQLIPNHWRLCTADWSILNRCSVGLIRAGNDYTDWFDLSDEKQDVVPLYAFGSGKDFKEAFENAIKKATPFESDFEI